MAQPLHIKNATISDGDRFIQRDLFIKNGKIVTEKPNHSLEIDLEGYTLFPGLVNAHDHLELNHFPRTKFREVYDNAHQWGEDVNARLNDEPFKTLRNYPLWDRVFIGGLKNLLCGATTVIHHGPPHKPMFRKDFPVRVLKKYGWAHSLYFNTEEEIIRSYKSTPKDTPWFIHLAEGTDDIAKGEYQRLKKMGCVGSNTVIVHGVGMTDEDLDDASKIIKAIVYCPSTSDYLLGQRLEVRKWRGKILIGSDSRLTAINDLHNEYELIRKNNAPLVHSPYRFSVYPRKYQWGENIYESNLSIPEIDNVKFPYADFCCRFTFGREDIELIVKGGIPQIGDPELMAKFPHIQTVACILDGVEKRMNVDLARQVHRCTLKETGLEVDELPKGKRFIFF
ncbi:MAG: amidohydrolase family protein [Phototrophicaceae bacterium]